MLFPFNELEEKETIIIIMNINETLRLVLEEIMINIIIVINVRDEIKQMKH